MSSFKERRIKYFTKPLFNVLKAKGLLPSISKTEKTALTAGDVWIEGDLFSGKPDFQKIFSYPYPKLTEKEQSFLDTQVEKVCAMTNDWEVFQNRDLPKDVWTYLKKERFFGMIIPQEFGGLGFSAYAHSCVIEKLVTHSQVLAITVMVPNSLGPAELLLRYGKQEQKQHYLPRLADGREIPCFALTEPDVGSDAASIKSYGEVFKDSDGTFKIRLQFEKRYITLGAIATVIGLAFKLKDPQNHLGIGEDLGITCALVDSKKDGVDQSRRHDPLNVPFVNAPLIGKDVIIDIDDIIGGKEGIGMGWTMLMESLAVGRGISLPSTSTGGSKLSTFVASTYSTVRYQFGLSIAKFEGVSEVIGRLAASTYLLDSAKTFTLGAIDAGAKPAVANAIMKQQSTEMFRKNILDAMDIQGGAAISRGPKNLLAHAYFGSPIGITVEGANIMTRSLIQFGQGVIRCHPYAYAQIEALEGGDLDAFDTLFFTHLKHVARNGIRAIMLGLTRGHLHRTMDNDITKRYEQKLSWASAKFAFLSDVALGLLGSGLKRRESISGRFGDILSQMYMMSAALKRFKNDGHLKEDEILLRVAMESGFNKIDEAFIGIYANISKAPLAWLFKINLFFVKINPMGEAVKDEDLHHIALQMSTNTVMRERICSNIYHSSRINELSNACEAMINAKEALAKEKKSGSASLTENEKVLIKSARKMQDGIVSVDSFTKKEYFK
ncbi:acyl-CoA dehydrogenase [Sulfurimonas sp.]|uniref:acyl-CoA dehydrogenase n=1 Tax=Sulfurimonas sp. TaxID=2022749 RepID=UPI003567DAD1